MSSAGYLVPEGTDMVYHIQDSKGHQVWGVDKTGKDILFYQHEYIDYDLLEDKCIFKMNDCIYYIPAGMVRLIK